MSDTSNHTTSCTFDHPKDRPCAICNPNATEADARAEEIHARLLQLSRAIPETERYLRKLLDERVDLTLELMEVRKRGC